MDYYYKSQGIKKAKKKDASKKRPKPRPSRAKLKPVVNQPKQPEEKIPPVEPDSGKL